jgi:RNA polymerase sporulation-specific sigma factor
MAKKKINKKTSSKKVIKKVLTKEKNKQDKPKASVARPGSIAEMVIKLQKEPTKAGQEIIFNEIIEKIDPLIKRIVGKFNIPGYEKSDLYQEALYAVRFKAISDFDVSRIIGDDFVGFEKFAALCVKRHLSTLLKCSFQNKKATLNTSVSFHALASEDDDNVFDMSSLMNSEEESQEANTEKQEIFRKIISNLMEHLSEFEKKVLALYAQRFSYEEISDMLNRSGEAKKINIKGVDNALSRIKIKAKLVVDELGIEPF